MRLKSFSRWALIFSGLGILLHDYCHALWEVGGYGELLSPQGGYVGLILILIGLVLSALNEKEVK